MDNKKYSAEHLKEWCLAHFPNVDEASDDVELEHNLRNAIIEGSLDSSFECNTPAQRA